MESRKDMERIGDQQREEVKTRRQYRQQVRVARPDEKARLRRERKNLVARAWYRAHRKQEATKRYERRQRTCCRSKKLGREVSPQEGAMTLWVTKCKVCGRRTYGKFGVNQQGRAGVFYRGRWFHEINPTKGTATTFQGKEISLTEV